MSPSQPDQPRNQIALAILLCLFVASGAAALIYEVAWFHLLRFAIGSSTLSLGILLASYMGGLFIGSLWYHRLVAVQRHPLKAYALIELGIGVCGVAIPVLLPQVAQLYTAAAGTDGTGILLRALLCAVLIVPPTILMGATLPAISRWMTLTASGYSHLGFLYSANLVGAVVGAGLTGFYLLRNFDVYVATAVAVSLNAAIAAASYGLARHFEPAPPDPEQGIREPWSWSTIHAAIGLSGLTALGSQVVWTRSLSLLIGGTVYTFSVIVAVFLVGLGAGSALGSYSCRRAVSPARMLAIWQFLLVVSIPYAAYAIASIIPALHFFSTEGSWFLRCADDTLRVATALLPATVLWGASFPVAVAAAGIGHRDPGKLVGQVYAANTVGAILGALGFSVVMMALVGTQWSERVLTLGAGLSAAVLLAAGARSRAMTPSPGAGQRHVLAAVAVVVVSLAAAWSVPKIHPGLIAFGHQVGHWDEPAKYLHVREGRHAVVAISRTAVDGHRVFHINGKIEASTLPEDMRLQRMLGHIPALLHPAPKSVLIIGFGAGVTAGVFTRYPEVERIVIVELEPEVLAASGVYFKAENYDVLHDPRTQTIIDDGRHYIATTKDKFDVITTDPIHPWAKGSAALYTREFFQHCAARLNPGGLVSQWVPLYETSAEAVKSEVGTFFEAYPDGSIWNSEKDLKGYDVVLLGHVGSRTIDADVLQRRLEQHEPARASLAEVNIGSSLDLLRAYAGRRADVAGWLAGYQPNLDRNLRLEYLAGEALDSRKQSESEIYNDMTAGLRYPEGFIRAGSEQERTLRRTFTVRYGNPDPREPGQR
jgi:spermidine synthase